MQIQEADGIAVAEQIDRLITTEIGGKFRTVTKNPIIRQMYDAARSRQGDKPVTYQIARALIEACRPGRKVIVTTGFMLDLWMHGEADGPPGAATLTRALEKAFDVKPILLTEAFHQNLVRETVRATGLREFPVEEAAKYPRRFSMAELPMDWESSRREAAKMFDGNDVAALIAIEKPGGNQHGIYHNSAGRDISAHCGKIEPWIDEAKRRGVLTVSIMDLGNEAGTGAVVDVARTMPNGARCVCPCGGGNVATSVVDYVLPAFVSNWGAYGLEATLAFLLDKPAVLHDATLERYVLQACAHAGGISAKDGYSYTTVDRVPESIHVNVIELLNYMVAAARDELATR
jgi:hypothetical protein